MIPLKSAGRSPTVPLPWATSRKSVAAAVELVMAATGGPFPQCRRRADQDWSAPDSDFATRWQIDALAESDRALLGQSLSRRSFADGLPVLGRDAGGLCSRPFCADLFEGRIPASGRKTSAADVNDHLVLPEPLDRVRPLRGRPGRPREKITTLIADKGYDYPRVYDELEQRRITAYIPRRGTRDKVTAGRWIVEHTLALLHRYRRLAVRWERRTDIHQGFLDLAAALICWRRLSNRT
ncbi:transposase [Nocardia sp. Root136]|uniref:transposase n=1 Tax=Nocardia sp. Root136 TaxID=1736458 RepID=UPI000A0691C0|nr:transposase [Nocardia sp. Root136]